VRKAVEGEDDVSIAKHHEDICRELHKARPDFAVVKQKLKCSVSHRQDIDKMPVVETLTKFPWLKNPKLVGRKLTWPCRLYCHFLLWE